MSLKLFVTMMLVSTVSSGVIRAEFFEEEIIKNDLTCWTCPEKDNNTQCNNWAPDVPCHTNHSVCQTIHVIDMTSHASLYVVKQCTTMDQCRLEDIGCHRNHTTQIMECVSCCTESYCNEAVPFNHTNALSLSSLELTRSSAAAKHDSWRLMAVLLLIVVTLASSQS